MFVIMKETFKPVQRFPHFHRRWRHKGRISRTGTANPVLRTAKFAWGLVRTAPTLEQDCMDLTD